MSDWEQPDLEVMVGPPSLVLRRMDTVTGASGDRAESRGRGSFVDPGTQTDDITC